MTYHFTVGFEVEGRLITIQADTQAEAESQLTQQMLEVNADGVMVTDWWVDAVEEEGTVPLT
jgi:hypothetical protein